MPVYILEQNTTTVKKTATTDKDGYFTMQNVPSGGYRFALDLVGVSLESSSSIFNFNENAGKLEVTAVIDTKDKVSVGITLNVITGIENIKTALALYPNPTTQFIRVELDAEQASTVEKWQVFAIDGKQIEGQNVSKPGDEIVIDVSNYPGGAYLLKIQFQNGLSVLRFVKN